MSYVRKISPYSTNQGNEKICWAHSIARLISRFIKIHFGERQKASDEFMFDEGELLDEYYDTINCSTENTIFHCIALTQDIHERKGKPFSIHKSLNKMINWDSENLSALLFHFILNCLKNKYGCAAIDYSTGAPIFYFLKLIHEDITEEKIKDILNYYDFQMPPFPPPPEPPLPDGWQARMSRTKNRPYWINTLTGKKTRKDPRGVVSPPSLAPEQSTLGRIAVVGGGLMEPTFRQVQENKVMLFSSLYPSRYFLVNDSGVMPLGAPSTDPSARCDPIPLQHNPTSKLAVSATPGEKQAAIPSKSSGIRYPPSLAPPTRMSLNFVCTGRSALISSFSSFISLVPFLVLL